MLDSAKSYVDELFDDFEEFDEAPASKKMSTGDISIMPKNSMKLFYYKDLLANPKQAEIFDMKDIESKARSIENIGLLQPLLVESIPGSRQAVLIAGHKRLAAIKMLVEEKNLMQFQYVWCKVQEPDEIMNELALIDTNLEASELSNYEKMMAIGRKEEILRENGQKGLRSMIASQSNLEETMVGYYLKLYKKLHRSCKQLLREEKLNIKQAIKISNLSEEEQERIAAEIESGSTFEEATGRKQDQKKQQDEDGIFSRDVAQKMETRLQTKVAITPSQIKISYSGTDDLNRVLELLGMLEAENVNG